MADSNTTNLVCSEEGCTVGSNGVCLNGLNPSTCPHASLNNILAEIEDAGIEAEINEVQESEVETRLFSTIYSGKALNINETQAVASSGLTKLIILAGPADAGKTTLLVSLFQLFQQQSDLADCLFAGSKTLMGLEERSHDSRIASDRNKAETPRTTIAEFKLLHLKVKKKAAPAPYNLLFTDISGEYFQLLRNSTEECLKFELGKKADHFVLFLDSKLLSDVTKRQKVRIDAMGILRSLLEAKVFKIGINLQIVFSRWDLLIDKENNDVHKKFASSIKEEIKEKFRDKVYSIEFFEIASRPQISSTLAFGYGIEKILPTWVDDTGSDHSGLLANHVRNKLGGKAGQFSKFKYTRKDGERQH